MVVQAGGVMALSLPAKQAHLRDAIRRACRARKDPPGHAEVCISELEDETDLDWWIEYFDTEARRKG